MKRKAILLTAITTISSLGVSMILPYIPIYGEEIGIPINIVGYLIFIYYGIAVITRIPIGFLSDALGHTIVIFAGGLMIVMASLFYMASTSIWYLLFGAQLLLGLGLSITWVTIPSFLTLIEGSLKVYTFSVGFGWLFGPIVGGFIKDYLGMSTLFFAFFLITIPLMTLTLIFYRDVEGTFLPSMNNRSLPKVDKTESSPPSASFPQLITSSIGSFSDAFGLLKKSGGVFIAAFVSFIMFMSFAMGNSLVPLQFSKVGLGSSIIGILLAIRTGTSTIIRLAIGKILKIGRKTVLLIVGAAFTGGILFLISFAESLTFLIPLAIVWGIGGGIYLPVAFDLIADSTTESERGVAMGLRGTLGTGGSAIGVLVFMNLADIIGVTSALLWFGISVIVLSGLLWVSWKIVWRNQP